MNALGYFFAAYCASVIANYIYAVCKDLDKDWGKGVVNLCVFLPLLNNLFTAALISDFIRKAWIYAKVLFLFAFFIARMKVKGMLGMEQKEPEQREE